MSPKSNLKSCYLVGLLLFIGIMTFGQRPGIECGCTKFDNYVEPSSKSILVEQGTTVQEGYSSKKKYFVVVEDAIPPNIVNISVLYNNKVIFNESNRATGWGFSPDEDKFVMHGLAQDGKHWCRLVNLDPDPTRDGEQGVLFNVIPPMWVSSSSIRFSPNGKYLLYAAITGSNQGLFLNVFDASNGQVVYDGSTGNLVGSPSGKSIAGWGFSPDKKDATFVHAYLTDVNRYTLIVKNLKSPAGEYVLYSANNQGEAQWFFSPCGDYFAWIIDSPNSDITCRLYRTDSEDTYVTVSAAAWWKLFSTADGHYIRYKDNSVYKIVDNTSDETCPDKTKPTWVNAVLDTGHVEGTKIELRWDGAKDNIEVTAYRIYIDNSLYKEVKAVKRFTVTGLKPTTEYEFKIEAGDEAGNWSNTGPVKEFTTFDDLPPAWPDPILISRNTTETRTTLEWKAAVDDYGIDYYRIKKNGEVVEKIDGALLSYTISELTAGETNIFRIEAGDAAGHWVAASDLTVIMPPSLPPYWPTGARITDTCVTETSMTIRWPMALDQFNAIIGYKVFMNGKFIDYIKFHEYPFTGLEEGTFYNFSIVAYDESKNASDTLKASLSTLPSHIAMPLIQHPANQTNPDISDRYVVWEDDRNDPGDIYAYDLQVDSVIRITSDPHKQFEPVVSGSRIVWTDTRNGNYDIYMWDPWNGETAVCIAPGDQNMPAIDDNRGIIVWSDNRNGNYDIYCYHIAFKQEAPVVTSPSNQKWPDIEGDYIVYTDDRNGNLDIYMTDYLNNHEYQICVKSGDQSHPAVYRAVRKYPQVYYSLYIVYEDQGDLYLCAPFYYEGEIYKRKLPLDETMMWTRQTQPHIENKQVVYVDDRPFNDDTHHSIYVYQFSGILPTSEGKIKLVGSESYTDQTNPRTWGGNIVWQYTKGTDSDIYIWKRSPGSDLQISVKESGDPVATGDTLKYVLTVFNNGPDKNVSVETECNLPLEARLISTFPEKGTVTQSGQKIIWRTDTLKYNSEVNLEIVMLTYTDCILEFTAKVNGIAFDPDPSNNTVSEKTKVKTVVPRTVDEGYNTGMLVENDGTVHLVYRKGSDPGKEGDLMYASKTRTGKWEYHRIGTCPPYLSGNIRLAMTSHRSLHVVYSDENWDLYPKCRLYHGVLTSDLKWKPRIIAVSDTAFRSLSLDVTTNDELYLAYIKANRLSGQVMIMKTLNGVWQRGQESGEGYCSVAIALDEADNLHLCTYDVNLGILYRKFTNNIPGPFEQVEPQWKGGQKESIWTSIMLDKLNQPHISYVGQVQNDNRENIKHAWKQNGEWHYEKVDDGQYYNSFYNKVDKDPYGAVSFGYFHIPSGKTRYASDFMGHWIKLPVDGSLCDFGMDGAGNGHMILDNISYVMIPPLDYINTDPDVLDFGAVQPGSQRTLSLVLLNPAMKELSIDSVKINDERFSFNKTSFVLKGFSSDTLEVTFKQNSTGEKAEDLITIVYNSPTGLIMDVPVRAASLTPHLQADQESVDFGSVPLNTIVKKKVTLKNTGATDLVFSNIDVKYEIFPGIPWPTDFQLSGHDCTTLHYGETCEVELSFQPQTEGDQLSYLNIYSNDPESPVKKIMITGSTTYPVIMPDRDIMNFSYVEPGHTRKDTLRIKNNGEAVLNFYGMIVTGTNKELFSIAANCTSLQPGDSCIVEVTFAPVTAGDFQAILFINSNSFVNNPLNVSLRGSSILRSLTPSDTHIVFGNLPVGNKAAFRLILSNNGTNSVSITGIRTGGADMYEFAHNYNSSLCNVIQPGAACTDTVWFIPLYEGAKTATLVICSNDSYKPEQTVMLSGTAILNDNSIAGRIWDETGLVSIAKSQVVLIPQSDISDTTLVKLIGTNSYLFSELPQEKFTVLAIPDPADYSEELPTYYGDNILLNNALWIQASGYLEGKDIKLIKKPPAGSGSGIISGDLITGSGKGLTVTENKGDIKGDPLPGVYVYLKGSDDGKLKAYNITGSGGQFVFTGLENGSYYFLADYMGKAMDPANDPLEISDSRKEIEIVAIAGSDRITVKDLTTGINDAGNNVIKVYPVPSRDYITVVIPQGMFPGKTVRIRIMDFSGKVIYIDNEYDLSGNPAIIDVKSFREGLYLLELSGQGISQRIKLVKLR